MAFKLMSPAFDNGRLIPSRHSCSGEDVSPPFEWHDAPKGTQSLALICDDVDAPGGVFHHWAVCDIPATWERLAEALPRAEAAPGGLRQAVNDFRRAGYAGPCPPKGHGIHHYHFRMIALDVKHLDIGNGA
jgi:Raf kinase inhibitor-like YbhB/YbcL family protein